MKTIWKFALKFEDVQTIEIPQGGTCLSVKVQHNRPCLWVEIDEGVMFSETLMIVVVGTGQAFKKTADMVYIDTVVMGVMVWHFYRA